MKRFSMAVFELYTVSDMNEGCDDVHLGYFVNSSDAMAVAKGKGPMGSTAPVRQTNIDIKVFESITEFLTEQVESLRAQRADIRKRALAKLTAEELEALGLNPRSEPTSGPRLGFD